MTNDIQKFEPNNLAEITAFSERLARSRIIPKPLWDKPEDLIVVLLTGKSFGLDTMQSLRSVHVFDGKPVMSASLIVGLCLRQREVCEYFTVVESTDQRAVCETKRVGAPKPTTLVWTAQQAQAAGLTGKDNWRKYPAAMLLARCQSALARAVYPDIVTGVYDPEEAEDFKPRGTLTRTDAPATMVAPAPAPVEVKKKVTPPKPAAPSPEPVEDAQVEEVEAVPVEEAPPAEPVPEMPVLERLAAAITEAPTKDDLTAVGQRIKAAQDAGHITDVDRRSLTAVYTKRAAELRRG